MVTIKEIAKAVGVSSGTVSRVLNYDQTLSISEPKRQAIIETAEALNYATPRARRSAQVQPLQIAMASHADVSARIAVIHFLAPNEELVDPYYVGVRLAIEARCREYKIEIARVFNPDVPVDPSLLAGLSAAIIVGHHPRAEIESLARTCPHLIMADYNPRMPQFDCVRADLGEATVNILDSLDRAGYGRIGFVGGYELMDNDALMHGEQRCKAFIEWHEARGRYKPQLLALGQSERFGQNLRLETGYQQARTLLALPERPDAIVAANDNMAIGTYRAIQEAGLKIPEDIAVIAFNDIPVAQFLVPPLSTMRIPGELIGETAVDLMVERLNGRDYSKHVTIPTQMVWRGSARKP
ncbi:LacI family DNA-binding transcriptional regulator [Rhizobium glycinendophyticum]|uniref:LacI family DNA-binding transcriptional regulator n=1 Tax=Rhizobium glycinendophyticum TaxID=2589807 RepID=A0A504ULI4_9HYPH|nr:LacI family DNA-binding transcriptional regulator [Rhizobium glycinendophyticum]TPP05933.1 LacI family DNA-binding transcriptional regulator [Rhizobium glycinendophyticum]